MLRYVAMALAILLMAAIFWSSSRSIDQSRGDSAWFMVMVGLADCPDEAGDTRDPAMMRRHNMTRKIVGHLVVFGTLAALLFASVYGYFGGIAKTALIALVFTAFYGATDEFHQIFTDRGASWFDVWLNTVGAAISVTVAGLVFLLIEKNRVLRKYFGMVYRLEPRRKS